MLKILWMRYSLYSVDFFLLNRHLVLGVYEWSLKRERQTGVVLPGRSVRRIPTPYLWERPDTTGRSSEEGGHEWLRHRSQQCRVVDQETERSDPGGRRHTLSAALHIFEKILDNVVAGCHQTRQRKAEHGAPVMVQRLISACDFRFFGDYTSAVIRGRRVANPQGNR